MKYSEYIQSKIWNYNKKLALVKANHKCQLCGFGSELDVHHLSYANLGQEKDGDLLVLCRRCHRDSHFYKNHVEGILPRDTTQEEYESRKKELSPVTG